MQYMIKDPKWPLELVTGLAERQRYLSVNMIIRLLKQWTPKKREFPRTLMPEKERGPARL